MTDNVVHFPGFKKTAPVQTMEELREMVESARIEQIEFLIDEIGTNIFGMAYDMGFDLGTEETMKDSILFVEALKSALYKSVGIFHPFQDLANQVLSDDDGYEEIEELEEDTKE